MPEIIGILLERVQTAAESAAAVDVEVPTGLDALDHAIGGLRSGDLILLIGAPGSGKSSLAISLIRHVVLDDGCPAVFASLQSKSEHVLLKIISGATRISQRNLGAGKLTDREWCVLADVTTLLATAPLMVCDSAVQSPQSLDADVLTSNERFGRCALLAIDHSQLLSPMCDANRESILDSSLRELCRELKLLARLRDCAVLLIESSNLGRAVVDLIPEADVILELRRTGHPSTERGAERCEIVVLKQQMGPSCTVLVQFSPGFGAFSSLGR